MSTFTDREGRTWTLDLNVDAVDQVQRQTGLSLFTVFDNEAQELVALLQNPPLLAHVCYVLAGAEEQGIDQRSFARAIKGDCFSAMAAAFLEELESFFPDARRREAIGVLRKAWLATEEKLLTTLSNETREIDPDDVAERVLTQMLSTRSGRSPATSGSRRATSAD